MFVYTNFKIISAKMSVYKVVFSRFLRYRRESCVLAKIMKSRNQSMETKYLRSTVGATGKDKIHDRVARGSPKIYTIIKKIATYVICYARFKRIYNKPVEEMWSWSVYFSFAILICVIYIISSNYL